MLRSASIRVARGVRAFCASPSREPGVVGLTAGRNPRQNLIDAYNETLKAVSSIPESSVYRVNVEKTIKYRMKVVQANENIEAIEAQLGVGPIEEVMEQARDELELVPHMLTWKPWNLEDMRSPVKIELID